jgi:TRAP-type C4-dicarboxylate transport system substrate-binding protein
MNTRSTGSCLALAATVALLAACATGADKSGDDTVVLRLATIDDLVNSNGQSYGPEAFVENLEKVSDGRIKVEMTTEYGQGAPVAESDLVEAIAAGDVDGGWPSTRAFANAGITGLEAVEAPMTLRSYAAEKDLVSGPVGDQLLAQLDGTGVVGLALAVGPLRRPFAAETPLLGPGDWEGATFRVYNSPVQTDAVRLLGATPVDLGFGWIDEMQAGRLRGVEFDIAQYAQMGNAPEAGYITSNVVLWPKVFVLSINKERFDALTDEQQDWVREAAEKAMQASVDATYDETTIAQELCEVGARFITASPDQIAALHSNLQPVLDGLAAEPANGTLLTEIQAIAAEHPEPEMPGVPADCQQGPAEGQPSPAEGQPSAGSSSEVSGLPDGQYRVEITTDDVAAAGFDNRDGNSGIWTFTVHQGTYEIRCRPLDDPGTDCGGSVQDEPFEAGYLRGTGNTVTLVNDAELMSELTGCKLPASSALPDHCGQGPSVTLTWEVEGDNLTLTGDLVRGYELVLEPWKQIG